MGFTKEERDQLKAQGLCIHCGSRPAQTSHIRCSVCLEIVRKSVEKRRIFLLDQGLCIACGKEPSIAGQQRCQSCIDRGKKLGKQRSQRLKTEGLCCSCGKNPVVPDRIHCLDCLKVIRQRNRRRIAQLAQNGLCKSCGQGPPQEGRTFCPDCLELRKGYTNARRAKRRKQGLCPTCGSDRKVADGHKQCSQCLARKRDYEARKRKESPSYKAKERDGFCCRLCGESDRQLAVHHIDGSGQRCNGHRNPNVNDSLDNLITLCRPCHNHIHKIARHAIDIDLALSLIRALE